MVGVGCDVSITEICLISAKSEARDHTEYVQSYYIFFPKIQKYVVVKDNNII